MTNRYSVCEPIKERITFRVAVMDNATGTPIGSGEALDRDGALRKATDIADALNRTAPSPVSCAAREALTTEAAKYIRDQIAAVGSCEHDVGHCVCADVSLAERLERCIESTTDAVAANDLREIRKSLVAAHVVSTHDLYKTGDKDAPIQILDRNNHVALNCCRRCGRAEIELSEPCAALPAAGGEASKREAEWQPIETAPKDGSRCDVWSVYTDAYETRGQRYVGAQYREHEAAWFDLYGNKLDWSEIDEEDDMKPRGRKTTHWMPIPGSPVVPEERAATTDGAA